MMSAQYLTLHMLNALPWHNMNRDANGRPKRFKQGGVERAMLSSQSLKRSARVAYEDIVITDRSFRSSRYGVDEVMNRTAALAADEGIEIDIANMRKKIEPVILHLVAGKALKKVKNKDAIVDEDSEIASASGDSDDGSAATNVWLSGDEIDTIARAALDIDLTQWLKHDKDAVRITSEHPIGFNHRVGSLAIAAFGRMFANASDRQTEAAIAVSPATTTHRVVIETDYFTVVDDLQSGYNPEGGVGASYIDTANFTSGVYYRSVTFDRAQLTRSWSGMFSSDADDRLRILIRSIMYSLPSGKKNSAPAQTVPLAILLEEQAYRSAYEFDTPVQPDQDAGGGYKAPSVARLARERCAAVRFDANMFGRAMVAGTAEDLNQFDVDVVSVNEMVEYLVSWLKS